MPIAKGFARKISFSVEDLEEATMDILMHLQEACKPEDQRRLNPRTGKPVAGYDPRKGKAFSVFYRAGHRKMMDIVKKRSRRWKRESKVINTLKDFGPLVTDERAELEASDMYENREHVFDE